MFEVNRSSSVPLAEQLVEGLTRLIESARLAEGARLPSVRSLARRAGVSAFTVSTAYERLLDRGLLESRRGSGHFVAHRRQFAATLDVELGPPPQADAAVRFTHSTLGSREIVVPAGCGLLPPAWYEAIALRASIARALRQHAATAAHAQGDGALRELIVDRLRVAGVAAAARNVVITAGASQAFDLIARRLLTPGDTVLVDDPGYFVLPTQLRAHQVRLCAVPRRADGPDLGMLEQAARLHRPRAFFTQTLLHNPIGSSASAANCHGVLSLAERHDFLIVEDHVYSDLTTEPCVSLAQIDELRRVLYVGSFTKVLTPGVRVGYVAAPEGLVGPLIEAKIRSVLTGSALSEAVIREVLKSGIYRRHLQQLRDRLGRARAAALHQLRGAGLCVAQEPAGGIFVWAQLPDALDAESLANDALHRGILLAPGGLFSITGGHRDHLRFNAAHATDGRLVEYLEGALAERLRLPAPHRAMRLVSAALTS